jgi:hypothetical protein
MQHSLVSMCDFSNSKIICAKAGTANGRYVRF